MTKQSKYTSPPSYILPGDIDFPKVKSTRGASAKKEKKHNIKFFIN